MAGVRRREKQLFLSHCWSRDAKGRDTHARVRRVRDELVAAGWTVWFDESDMDMRLDASMMRGIDGACAVVCCLTAAYLRQLDASAFNPELHSNNCAKEWNYAIARNKRILAVVLEPDLMGLPWPASVVSMYIHGQLYVDGSADDDVLNVAARVTTLLTRSGIAPAATTRRHAAAPRRGRVRTIVHV